LIQSSNTWLKSLFSWTVNLGPVSPAYNDTKRNPQPNGLGFNPRCLRRDINTYATQNFLKDSDVTSLITNFSDIYDFQTYMQGNFFSDSKYLGVHTAGHFVVGADPGGDLFASPGDPYFYLHHAMIDRTFWTWQNQDVGPRTFGKNSLSGTITINNQPPSRNTTKEDVIDLGVNTAKVKIGDTLSTIAGPFCYIYA
jgi:tyrosinase